MVSGCVRSRSRRAMPRNDRSDRPFTRPNKACSNPAVASSGRDRPWTDDNRRLFPVQSPASIAASVAGNESVQVGRLVQPGPRLLLFQPEQAAQFLRRRRRGQHCRCRNVLQPGPGGGSCPSAVCPSRASNATFRASSQHLTRFTAARCSTVS